LNSLWLRIKVWTKLALFALLSVYVLTFIFKNIGPKVDLWVWYFAPPITMPVLLLALVVFVIGVLGTVLSRTTYRTIRQLRELREKTRSQRLEREVADMRTKAAMLRSRSSAAGGAGETPVETELP
jgi:uncharacterized integral membrane protein